MLCSLCAPYHFCDLIRKSCERVYMVSRQAETIEINLQLCTFYIWFILCAGKRKMTDGEYWIVRTSYVAPGAAAPKTNKKQEKKKLEQKWHNPSACRSFPKRNIVRVHWSVCFHTVRGINIKLCGRLNFMLQQNCVQFAFCEVCTTLCRRCKRSTYRSFFAV